MIVLMDDELVHVDSSLDVLEHYGVKGMKWGKHRANMRLAKALRKQGSKNLEEDKVGYGVGYILGYALGQEGNMAKDRHNNFKDYADKKAKNHISVKKQKYIDKYSSDSTTKGLNTKGQRKYSKLKKKASKLSNKYYDDIESHYQNTKGNYYVSIVD